jgi:hypothetical protein
VSLRFGIGCGFFFSFFIKFVSAGSTIANGLSRSEPWAQPQPQQYQQQLEPQQQQDRYRPPYQRSMDSSRPPFVGSSSFGPQDARVQTTRFQDAGFQGTRSQETRPADPPQLPRITDVNLVEEMRVSSALDGMTVDVSMIEEIYAVEKRKATQSGPDSDGSDARVAKKVAGSSSTPVVSSIVERPKAGAQTKIGRKEATPGVIWLAVQSLTLCRRFGMRLSAG